jgi:hypothetical protein
VLLKGSLDSKTLVIFNWIVTGFKWRKYIICDTCQYYYSDYGW